MRDHTHQLLATRALLTSAAETIDRLVLADPNAPRSPEDREILAVTAMIAEGLRPRSKADMLRFARAVKAGDPAWLVVHSLPGEHRADASYHAHLAPEVRRALG